MKNKNEITLYSDQTKEDLTEYEIIHIKKDIKLESCKLKGVSIKIYDNCKLEVSNTNFTGYSKISNKESVQICFKLCNIEMLAIVDSKIDKLYIRTNEIKYIEIDNCEIKKLDIFENEINTFFIKCSTFENIYFDIQQLKKIEESYSLRNLIFRKLFNDGTDKLNKEHKGIISDKIIRTVSYFEKYSNIKNLNEIYLKFKYLQLYHSQKGIFRKFFIFITGGFFDPWNFIILMLVIIGIASIIYYLLSSDLSYGLSLYLSGISFTTIGFGDIVPKGIGRVVVIVEGILGNIIMASLLVSIINKYKINND